MGGIDRVITTKEPKIGIRQAIRWINKKILRRNVVDPLDKLAEDMGSASYERTVRKMIERLDELEPASVTIDGKVISEATPELFKAPTSASKITIGNVFDLTKNPNLGEKAADDEFKALLSAWYNIDDPLVKTTVWQRAGQLVKGYTGLPAKVDRIPTWKRQVVMASSILLSYAYMMEESKADKYHVSQNSVVLSWPPMYTFLMKNPTDPANNNYEAVKLPDLKSNTWVQLRIPEVIEWSTEGGMPLYLASPCKADVSVKYGTCKCEKFTEYEKMVVLYKTRNCKVPASTLSSSTTLAPLCPATGSLDQNGDLISGKDDNCPIGLDSKGETTLEYDVDKITTSPTIDAATGNKLCQTGFTLKGAACERKTSIDEALLYTQCYVGNTEACNQLGTVTGFPVMRTLCAYSYSVLNAGPSREGGLSIYKTCTKEGWSSFLTSAPKEKEHPCIQISVDKTSMSNYATAGFKPNYCRMSKDKGSDVVAVGIDVGVLVGSIALTVFPPTSAAGAALVPVVLGVGGGAGSALTKYIDIKSKWPEDQF